MTQFTNEITKHCHAKKANCGGYREYRECYLWEREKHPYLNDFLRTFPVITFYFNDDIPYKWHPQDYMILPLDSNVHYCIGVKTLSHTILGALFMRNYDIYFDRTAKQIGFKRANCGLDPYFINDLSIKPSQSLSKGSNNIDETAVSSKAIDKNETQETNVDNNKIIKKKPSNPGMIYSIIFIMLLLCVLVLLLVLRYLWKYNKNRRNLKSEVGIEVSGQFKDTAV